MGGYRDQLWAEALKRHQDEGRTAELPRDLHTDAAQLAERHRRRDTILEDGVGELARNGKLKDDTLYTLTQVASELGMTGPGGGTISIGQRDQNRIGAALASEGYSSERTMVDGKRRRGWIRRSESATR